MNGIINRFPKGTWVEDWPHKVNLDEKPDIAAKLMAMADDAVRENHLQHPDARIEWIYDYIDQLGNDIFLEGTADCRSGFVLFHTDEEVIEFILTHS